MLRYGKISAERKTINSDPVFLNLILQILLSCSQHFISNFAFFNEYECRHGFYYELLSHILFPFVHLSFGTNMLKFCDSVKLRYSRHCNFYFYFWFFTYLSLKTILFEAYLSIKCEHISRKEFKTKFTILWKTNLFH